MDCSLCGVTKRLHGHAQRIGLNQIEASWHRNGSYPSQFIPGAHPVVNGIGAIIFACVSQLSFRWSYYDYIGIRLWFLLFHFFVGLRMWVYCYRPFNGHFSIAPFACAGKCGIYNVISIDLGDFADASRCGK